MIAHKYIIDRSIEQLMTRNLNNMMMRFLTVIMLIIFSMGAKADVNVEIGKFNGGTIVEKSQTAPDANGLVTVTITVTPDKGFTIKQTDIVVVSTYAPDASGTRSPKIAAELTLLGTDPKDLGEPRDYTFIVGASLGAWVKEANFHGEDAKGGGNRDIAYTEITSLGQITSSGNYIIKDNIDASNFTTIDNFSGTLTAQAKADGTFPVISNLSVPLFTTATDATISNIIIGNVDISQSGKTGSIACVANGATRIYNCGILSGEVKSTGTSNSDNSTDCCGGLVGELTGSARVINCYSYATITDGNRVGGIVGYNNATTTAASINTMVMNCMFYGDITAGNKVSPIYGGNIINNLNSGGLNNFNYYAYDNLKAAGIEAANIVYNCALAVEEKYLNRLEFYRLLLNSNKKLAAFYVTGNVSDADKMAKWVLETADRSISGRDPYPYPILKAQGYYPSIVNIDAENAPSLILENDMPKEADRKKGGKLGKTLTVHIGGVGSNAPDGASIIRRGAIILPRTDKDFDRFNFNYDKVQLPYYNDVGTKNYTGNKVVTGWKIVGITSVANDPYTSANYDYTKNYSDNPEYFDYSNYNFADRKSSQKDLYAVSGRVFSQGAYFDVPYGVTSITIEPYWGHAAYVSDQCWDVVCKKNSSGRNNYEAQQVTQLGNQFNFDNNGKAASAFNNQDVYTSISKALADSHLKGSSVYENAVVLVGNLHHIGTPSDKDLPFSLMSVDIDKDNEPDYSLIYCDNDRHTVCPLRFDFLNIPGMAQAQKPSNTNILLNAAIFRTKGWFEITNTAQMYFTQYEYENQGSGNTRNITKKNAPLILLGGYVDQFVSAQSYLIEGKTIYIHVGSNVLINSFGLGTHGDGSKGTPHVPVSVTGGDFNSFYLTGTYNQNADIVDDNAECYISGGRFGELAGASQEQIGSTGSENNGNVRWQIYDADITEFFGGGINEARPVQGNVTTEIFNSHVNNFYGGPKFGNMASGKKVTTTAEKCTFDKFFGAGYGGNSFSRVKYFDSSSYNFDNLQKYYYNPGSGTNHENERGKYYNGNTAAPYGKKGPGVATDFDYEFFVWTSGATGARFFIKFVSFSLAKCNDVESTLKKCIINENFYGGGRLGTVTGTTTSLLENCTVTGNVFGAGYSVTVPKIEVRRGGFSKKPNFNGSSGMFEPGVPTMPTANDLTDTDEYEWIHKDSYPNTGTVGFVRDDGTYSLDGKNVVTTQNLSPTNLGSVGSVVLTLQGNTTVGGSVYGGGEQSTVNGTGTLGNTKVTLKGNTHVTGNVFGGGDSGSVSGSTTVNIEN